METTSQKTSSQKGKQAEFLVFGELIRRGADLYLPVIDIGIDAVIRKKDGTCFLIQVKSTEAPAQVGWFTFWVLERYKGKNLFTVCVEMSKKPPEIWVLPSEVFMEYANVSNSKKWGNGYTLGIDSKDRKHGNKLRRNLLKEYQEAWGLLTG
jgi:hypothetical protein